MVVFGSYGILVTILKRYKRAHRLQLRLASSGIEHYLAMVQAHSRKKQFTLGRFFVSGNMVEHVASEICLAGAVTQPSVEVGTGGSSAPLV